MQIQNKKKANLQTILLWLLDLLGEMIVIYK